MPMCEFTVNGIDFTCSYGDGLIIPLNWLQRAGLYNMEFMRSLELAFETTHGLNRLMEVAQANTSFSDRVRCTYEQLEQLSEFYELVQKFGVVIHNTELLALLKKTHEQNIRRQPPEKPKQPDVSYGVGYVYLLNEINGVHYKIGHTSNPKNRLKTFSVKLPYRVEFEALIPTDNMHTLEAQLHAKFADKRVDGEWFALEPADVEYVKSLAVQS